MARRYTSVLMTAPILAAAIFCSAVTLLHVVSILIAAMRNDEHGLLGHQRAAHRAMTTMVDDGAQKCRTGMTSVAEVLRVTTIR